jgi:hypothetical protein
MAAAILRSGEKGVKYENDSEDEADSDARVRGAKRSCCCARPVPWYRSMERRRT